ncbi:hypothetical protein [Streptomyces sp. NBC_01727]|uniref:hypothetical protein n=1 Tax=Streptomyces sp. NBC_01727 TaxID=2975924 RepID=UPI002E0E4CB7
MTGASAATGYSLQHVHTAIEITVLAVGWLLGWTMGIDTVPASRWRSARIQFALRRSTERAVGEERRLQGFVSDGSMLR